MSLLRPGRRAVAALAVATSAWVTGCKIPKFSGPQIQSPPPAFTLKNDTYQGRRMFNDREILYHSAWVEASWGNFSGIYINGHTGVLGIEEVEAARTAAIEAGRGKLGEFGELERLTIDGRTGWGWGETWRHENGGLQFVAFRVAVPYDTITYTVEFLTGDPGLKIRPDSLRTVAASFAIGHTEWNLPLLAIGAGLVLFGVGAMRSRARSRAEVTRRITLVQVPKPDQKEGTAAGAGGAPPGGQPEPPPPASP